MSAKHDNITRNTEFFCISGGLTLCFQSHILSDTILFSPCCYENRMSAVIEVSNFLLEIFQEIEQYCNCTGNNKPIA